MCYWGNRTWYISRDVFRTVLTIYNRAFIWKLLPGLTHFHHKLKSYDIFWKFFYYILSFLSGKGVLIHLDRISFSESAIKVRAPQGSSFVPTLSLSRISEVLLKFDEVLLVILVSTQNVTRYLPCTKKVRWPLSRNCALMTQLSWIKSILWLLILDKIQFASFDQSVNSGSIGIGMNGSSLRKSSFLRC